MIMYSAMQHFIFMHLILLILCYKSVPVYSKEVPYHGLRDVLPLTQNPVSESNVNAFTPIPPYNQWCLNDYLKCFKTETRSTLVSVWYVYEHQWKFHRECSIKYSTCIFGKTSFEYNGAGHKCWVFV